MKDLETAIARELSVFFWLKFLPAVAIVVAWWNWDAIKLWWGPM